MITLFHGVTIMQEDILCVKQTLDGDEQAFHRLIIKYYPAIHALVLSWVKNREDTEDLMQEIFLRAYQELDSLRHPEQFRLWLRQIARHQCQNWLRKEKTFLQLDDDMICETPLADETLILQETLAKVMKAIDELPKSESQLLKERYLDDASYNEMETRHGLSHSVLAMRLLRARQHVREKIKLLSGVLALSWQDMVKKIFVGGIEAMKISAKVKIIAIGVGTVLVLGGAGVIVWHHQSTQEKSVATISQTNQQEFFKELANTSVKRIRVVSMSKPNQTSNHTSKQEQQKPEVSEGKTEDVQPKIASGTETSKTDANKTTISPELEITFRAIKSYRDKVKAIRELQRPYGNRIDEVNAKLNAINNAIDNEGTSNEEWSRLIGENEQLTKESQELAVPYNQLYAQVEQVVKEADEYVQARYGMSYVQFGEIYSEIFYSWEKAQDAK
ncbi:MAG: polymerase sigma-70 factor, subfamily [Candidatus Poribacteria bacterium]|nr:polymerase sigma-70 factor, subfamily [Candidatus Poribacteria bacterium]